MTNLEILEDKYIELLLKKCINFNNSKSLFINYDRINKAFVEKVIIKAKEIQIRKVKKVYDFSNSRTNRGRKNKTFY